LKVLVTGGLGYIGAHICTELLNRNDQVIVIDNLSNSNLLSIERVAQITKKNLSDSLIDDTDIVYCNADIRNRNILKQIFKRHRIDAVIHLAGYKSISESIKKPLDYYNNNVIGSVILFEEMMKAEIKNIIFSSSACVYGISELLPIDETFPVDSTKSPYAHSKLVIEDILKCIYKSCPDWKISLLRYFNPVGAHPSGMIGEDPIGAPNNLIPYITQVAIGKRKKLKIFGNDYPTIDGTGVRDYIHVVDLAIGHLAALDYQDIQKKSLNIFNLGTGKGNSVLEMVSAFEKVSGKKIPYEIVERRNGDIAECWSSVDFVEQKIGWRANFDIHKMCEDAWRWQQQNPEGYTS